MKKTQPQGQVIGRQECMQPAVTSQPKTIIEKNRLLLHSCCGPCSTACIERLITDYKITVFFYNPNITDMDEYELRKENQIKFIDIYNQR